MTIAEIGQIIKDLTPLLSAIGVVITFLAGVFMWWGGQKQKDKYRDETLEGVVGSLKAVSERVRMLETFEHCQDMKCECEEDRAREVTMIIERIQHVEDLGNRNYEKLEHTTRRNFEKVFDKLEELATFRGALEEFKNGGVRPPGS